MPICNWLKAIVDVKEVGAAPSDCFQDQGTAIFSTTWGGALDTPFTATSCPGSDGYFNVGNLRNDQLDASIGKANQTHDFEERKKIHNHTNEHILGEASEPLTQHA
jgi:hypothetical protein